METSYVYLNGTIVPADQAAVSPFDIGLLRGYAVFDLLRTVGGRPFLLGEHLKRFRESAAHLGLTVPVGDDEILRAVTELLERNDHEEATVRFVLTGGVSPDGMHFDVETPTFLILTHELHVPAEELYARGGKLITHLHRREVPLAKTTNYLTMVKNRPLAEESRFAGMTLADSRLREEQGITVVAIERDGATITAVTGSTVLLAGDTLVAVGSHEWTPADLG